MNVALRSYSPESRAWATACSIDAPTSAVPSMRSPITRRVRNSMETTHRTAGTSRPCNERHRGFAGPDHTGRRSVESFHEHLRVPAALLVLFPASGRQIVGRALGEAAFGLKIRERLRRERKQLAQTRFARP